MGSSRAARLARLVLLGAAYLVLARLGLRVATVGNSVTLVWPPTGLALAALLLGSRGLWPAVAAGAFLVNVTTPGVSVFTAAAIAVGNTLEALVGATLVRRRSFRPQLDETRHVLRFAVLGAGVATAVSATIGVLALWGQGIVAAHDLLAAWRVWWVGDAMGALVVAPALLCWGSRAVDVEHRSGWEAFALAVSLTAASLVMLTEPHATHPYLVFPPLIWAALRFGPRGAATATLCVSVLTVASTITGRGAFVVSSMGHDLMNLEAFLAAVALTSLILGATTAERVQAIRAREQFISVASHELRAPLAPIRLQVQRLLRSFAKNPDGVRTASVIESLQVVERQSQRLSRLLENVLDTTRLELGRLPLHPEDVDAAAIFDEVAATLREPLARAGCTLTVEKRGTPKGHWDRARLGQVLTNLVSNAVKHGGRGPIEVSLEGGPTRTVIVVRDHGPGVAPEERDRIFDRYEHTDKGPPDSGLGLGLYVAREIVDAHGGRLTVDSAPGGGAAFAIDLPARPPGEDARPALH